MPAMVIPRVPYGSFPSRPVRVARFGALRLTETVYAPSERLPTHVHDHAALIFVLRGGFTESFGPTSHTRNRLCSRGEGLFRPGDEEHADRFSAQGGRCLNVEIPTDWREGALDNATCVDLSFKIGRPADGIGARLLQECCAPDASSALIVEGLVLELLGTILREKVAWSERAAPPWLRRACELLAANLAEVPSLTQVAAEVARSPAQLVRGFRSHLGCTAGEFIRRLRVAHASRQLAETARPLAAIALESGFCDQSHFCRVFRRLLRTTPAAYRAAHRAPSQRTKA